MSRPLKPTKTDNDVVMLVQQGKNYREIIQYLVDTNSPKRYAQIFQRYETLSDEITTYGSQYQITYFMEALYCYLHQCRPKRCDICNDHAVFATVVDGYRKLCKKQSCFNANQSSKITKVWAENPDKKQQMVETLKATCQERYGVSSALQVPEVQAKIAKTNIERYGAANPLESDVIKEKIRQTNLLKYGVEYHLQSPEIQAKCHESFHQNHPDIPDRMYLARKAFEDANNGLNPFQVESVKKTIKATLQQKYGCSHPRQQHLSPETLAITRDEAQFREFVKGKSTNKVAHELKMGTAAIRAIALKYNCQELLSGTSRSNYEYKVQSIFDELNLQVTSNNRLIIKPLELDFYLPSHKFAIDVGSVYWHSSGPINNRKNADKIHSEKYERCQALGINVLQLFDKAVKRPELIKQMIQFHTDPDYRNQSFDSISINPISEDNYIELYDQLSCKTFFNCEQYYLIDGQTAVMIAGTIDNTIMSFAPEHPPVQLMNFALDHLQMPILTDKLFGNYALYNFTTLNHVPSQSHILYGFDGEMIITNDQDEVNSFVDCGHQLMMK